MTNKGEELLEGALPGSARTRTIDAWLRTHAAFERHKPALNFEGKTYSYIELHEWVELLAATLQNQCGVSRGDRIAWYGKNSATQVALMFAAAKLGAIFVPLNWRLAAAELGYVISDCTPVCLFHDRHFSSEVSSVLEGAQNTKAISADDETSTDALPSLCARETGTAEPGKACFTDPFLIVYTSGTTGRPKGAVLTQEAIFWNAVISQHAHEFNTRSHILNFLPLFHVGGINIQMMPCFYAGGTVTLHTQFEPDAAIETLASGQLTHVLTVPTILQALLAHRAWNDLDLSGLHCISIGSTDVPVELIEQVHARGVPLIQIYGSTETGPVSTYQKAQEAFDTVGSIGRCALHTAIRLMDENGTEVPTGEPGEIWVKGPNNLSHYWNNPDATRDYIVDGWFRTGDVARLDENGLYWFADRTTHVIISGGENIYPAELERVIRPLPGISEVAVVGRPDSKWGEVPVVVTATADNGPTAEEILHAFNDEVARFKHPRDVIFVDELPKNALGKTLIPEVRKLARQ